MHWCSQSKGCVLLLWPLHVVTLALSVHRGRPDPAIQAANWGRVHWQSAETQAGPQPLGELRCPSFPSSSEYVCQSPTHCLSLSAPPADQIEASYTESECGRTGSLPLWPVGPGKSSGCDVRGVDVGTPCLSVQRKFGSRFKGVFLFVF